MRRQETYAALSQARAATTIFLLQGLALVTLAGAASFACSKRPGNGRVDLPGGRRHEASDHRREGVFGALAATHAEGEAFASPRGPNSAGRVDQQTRSAQKSMGSSLVARWSRRARLLSLIQAAGELKG